MIKEKTFTEGVEDSKEQEEKGFDPLRPVYKMKIKRFSGYSEAAPEGVTYQKSSQVITRYILDPLDSSVDTLEETDKLGVTKRKSDRIKKVIKPLKKYFKYKSNKNSN